MKSQAAIEAEKAEVVLLRSKIAQLVVDKPSKAARILMSWIGSAGAPGKKNPSKKAS